jgi:myo-inositol 2-dehydrogenase/D-chiro-inositol 1-dehydrogenase
MTVRVGVIGAGAIGADHVNRLSTVVAGAEVVAITDIATDRARSLAHTVNARTLPTATALISAPEVDAVLVASSGRTHEEFALACLAAGKPMFCEKPLATTADGCRRIVQAEVEAGRRLVQVGFMRRYDDGHRALRDTIASGKIGPALLVHAAHRNRVASVSGYTNDMAVTDTAVHEIDALRWILDEDFVAATVLSPRRSSTAPKGLADPQVLLLETAGAVLADIEVYVNCRYGYDIRCEIVGETGTVSLGDQAPVVVRDGGVVASEICGDWRTRFAMAYEAELRDWIAAVAAETATGPSAWDGYAAALTTDACLAARACGVRVPIEVPPIPTLYQTPVA